MGLDRRTFLQQAGLALFTWGATEAGISSIGSTNSRFATLVKNYQQTLAESTSRKLALLVGINNYPHQEQLHGCLTDVELQRELLIHRFGFNPQDIIVLSDRQATRENIETTFIEHLSKQAQANDVVVFHFSGYGGQVKMPLSSESLSLETVPSQTPTAKDIDAPSPFKLVNSFVPVDGMLTTKKTAISNSILQDTLLVLAQSLSTSKCTFVLDTSFSNSPRSRHSSLKIRSMMEIAENSSPQELIFLEKLTSNFAAKGFKPSKRLLSLPGVVLSASHNNQVAAEKQWNGFSAGLFTQALTQLLWQITPSRNVQIALGRTVSSVEQVMGRQQQPSLNNPDKSAIAYFLPTTGIHNATGVVSQVSKNNINNSVNNIEIKLLGLPATILNCYGINSCLDLICPNNSDFLRLQIQFKEGLVAKARLLQPEAFDCLYAGQLVRESIRILERNLSLNLALDKDMQRIERVDATSALANISGVHSAVISGEQNADCLLGKINYPATKTDDTRLGQTFSYALYTAGGALIDKTTGIEEEAVKIAIDRLQPQFSNLLAAKWLELSNNEFSSGLKVGAVLTAGKKEQSITLQRNTFLYEEVGQSGKKLGFTKSRQTLDSENAMPILAKGLDIQLTLDNPSDQSLHILILGIDSNSNIFALYTPSASQPTDVTTQLKNLEIPPEGKLAFPPMDNSWKWKVSDSVGINNIYVVFSVQPFAKTFKALAAQQNFKLDQQQFFNVTTPVVMMNSLMEDLHDASSVSSELLPSSSVYALDVNSWTTLNFVYEIVNS